MKKSLRILRWLARSKLSPDKPILVSDEALAEEQYKVEGHQLSLGAALGPLVVIALDFGFWGKSDGFAEKTLTTVSLVLAAVASILLLGLIQVSRDRIRSILLARLQDEKSTKSHAISLKVLHTAHAMAVFSYLGLAVLILFKIWAV